MIAPADASPDVVVIGGGNAGICAAIAARERGARVLLLEHAPKFMRGGNSRHTRNLRIAHDAPQAMLSGAYPGREYWSDLLAVTAGKTDERLAQMVITRSSDLLSWMSTRGVRFQPPLTGTLSLGRTNAFFLGGGKALLNAYYGTAERMGVAVAYDTEVQEVTLDGHGVRELVVANGRGSALIRPRAVVAAAGGFQANIPWLRKYWGDAAENFLIRGTPYAKGRILQCLLDQGVEPVSDPTQFHAIAIDARSPKFDGGIVTRLDCVPFSIVVDGNCDRFYDEGEDLWPKRYAIWGRLIAQRPGQIAYSIFDSKSSGLFMPSVYPVVRAESVGALAAVLGLDAAALERTVAAFNDAVRPGTFDRAALDDCATDGLVPSKSHWARTIDTPPYFAYPLRPGITFTYLGVRVDERARVVMTDGQPTTNLFATGEIMAGNILGQGYLGGLGMTIGTVFGRIAGEEAAAHALH